MASDIVVFRAMGGTFDPRSSADSAFETPKAGDVLAGKYRVERILGVGGMGIVVAAEHLELGQQMAIKMMLPGGMQDPQAVARFLREARSAAGLTSEHVVRIFDVGTLESGAPYMVMELLRGQDLSQMLLNFGRLGIKEAVDYVVQACHAIGEAHAKGIVHRDLKPSNLFLTERSDGSPLVKVLDFGISKAASSEIGGQPAPSLTATSAVMGSPLYMSPEQVRNARHVDARADIWSMGVILHELLSGAPAFQADTLPGICAAIIADDAAPLRTLRDDIPMELEAVVTRCLQKDVRKRFQTTRELMAALRPLASSIMQAAFSSALSPPINATMRSDREPAIARSAPRTPPSSALAMASSATAVAPSGSVVTGGHTGPREPAGSMTAANVTVASRAPPRPAPRKGSGLAIALGGVAVAVGAAALFVATRHPAGTAAGQVALPTAALSAPTVRRAFTLTIDSNPSGADLLEGDARIGTTPIQISVDNESVRTAPRKLAVQREGFLPYSIVQGPSDDNVRLFASLVPAPADTAAPAAKNPAPARPAVAKHVVAEAKPVPSTPPAVTPVAPPPPSPPPSDIRLQR
jgi:eukaryotic-like serine/threonine-protein kinase